MSDKLVGEQVGSPHTQVKSSQAKSIEVPGVEVKVLRSDKTPNTYLYLTMQMEFDDLPETLRRHFGEPETFLQFNLTAERKLALAQSDNVLRALEVQGFYLQLPPTDPVVVDAE